LEAGVRVHGFLDFSRKLRGRRGVDGSESLYGMGEE
jgi:hypothetical protein